MPFTSAGVVVCFSGPGLVAVTRYLALIVGDPTAAGVEVSATGYARLARTTAQMPITGNEARIDMGEWDDSANASWGIPTYVGLYTAATGGTLLAYGQISPALSEITSGSRVFANAADNIFRIPLS